MLLHDTPANWPRACLWGGGGELPPACTGPWGLLYAWESIIVLVFNSVLLG